MIPDDPSADARRVLFRQVARLAWPAIGQQLLHTAVFLVDRAMLGRYSSEALASMQISGPIVWSLFSVISAFAVGSVALVGRAVGARDERLATAATRASLGFAGLCGLLAAVLGVLLIPVILAAFPESGEAVQGEGRAYLEVAFFAMPFGLLSLTAASALQAAGDTKTPFYVAAAGNLLNILVSYVLVFGAFGAPELGARGAAIGSAAALALQAVVLLGWLRSGRGRLDVRARGGERDALRRVLRISGPALAERLVQHVGFLGFVMMVGYLGWRAMAANQALISLEAISFLSADGLGIAAAAVVAQRLGSRDAELAKLGARVATWMGVGLLSAAGLMFVAIPELLLRAFTDDAGLVALGVPCLLVAAAAQPFMGAAIVSSQALRGAGETRVAFVVTLVGGLLVRLGATYLFAFELDLGLVGVWLGSTCDWIVRAVILSIVTARSRRWLERAV